MFSPELNPGLGRSGRVVPRLEGLEDRCCPSTILFNTHTHLLTLTGDASSSTVMVRDDGRGDVTVTGLAGATAAHPRKFTGVSAIEIDSKTGNDRIDYALTGVLTRSDSLNLNLGRGDDSVKLDFTRGVSAPNLNVNINGTGGSNQDVTALFGSIHGTDLRLAARLGAGLGHFTENVNGNVTGKANVNMAVTGGKGSDGISVKVNGDIAATAHVSVQATAGSNDSTLHVDYNGKLSGHLSILERTGPGWDWMESDVNLKAGSTGWLKDHLVGGTSNDLLLLKVHANGSALKGLDAEIVSGPGNATAHTANVRVVRAP